MKHIKPYMKHLKPFNESKEIFVDELKDFCETNLAYLLDDSNFELEVDEASGYTNAGQIRLENDEGFKWNDIKDYFIPFLIQLNKIDVEKHFDFKDRVFIYKPFRVGSQKLISNGYHSKDHGWFEINFDNLVNDLEIDNQTWTKISIYFGSYF
jgi:hypothetical protein